MRPSVLRRNAARIVAGALLLAAVGLAALFISRSAEPEPVYEGKSLRFWLRAYHKSLQQVSETSQERARAERAIRRIGTNGIPTLLRMLRARDSAVISKLQEHDPRQLLLRVNSNPAWLQNWDASMGFELLGQEASGAVPALLEIYEQNISGRSRMAAGQSLASIGPAARAAVPTLIRAATNSDASMRPSALWGLMGIHSDPASTIPVMVACLNDTNRLVRSLASRGLAEFGAEAYPVLTQLLKGEDANLSRSAADALNKIQVKAPEQSGSQFGSRATPSPTNGSSQ